DMVTDYQKLCRPKIEELLGAKSYERCCGAMLAAYDEFAPDLPILEDSNNRDIFLRNAPFILSLYRALLGEFALGRDAALDTVSQITDYKVREQYGNDPVMKFIMSRIAADDLFRRMFLKIWERQDEEYGWTAEFPASDAYIAVDVTRCGLVDWYTDQGVPEIARIGCDGDYIMAEFMTGLELVRTKTIANGDDVCDFRYIKVEV
ncbi:MAG: L-2-amino-thiazoline-4-carboxylic acid hydrolase, partial [Anaerolineae bacterium]|nr:L-2-amino-thiazoline-4-carboxylic acid hydrolase [Anaerolineae bacterium]